MRLKRRSDDPRAWDRAVRQRYDRLRKSGWCVLVSDPRESEDRVVEYGLEEADARRRARLLNEAAVAGPTPADGLPVRLYFAEHPSFTHEAAEVWGRVCDALACEANDLELEGVS